LGTVCGNIEIGDRVEISEIGDRVEISEIGDRVEINLNRRNYLTESESGNICPWISCSSIVLGSA